MDALKTSNGLQDLSLCDIAYKIYDDHKAQGKQVNYAAKPYLQAMTTLQNISEDFGADSGSMIVAYLLSNLSTWKGETARSIKKELNRRLKGV